MKTEKNNCERTPYVPRRSTWNRKCFNACWFSEFAYHLKYIKYMVVDIICYTVYTYLPSSRGWRNPPPPSPAQRRRSCRTYIRHNIITYRYIDNNIIIIATTVVGITIFFPQKKNFELRDTQYFKRDVRVSGNLFAN